MIKRYQFESHPFDTGFFSMDNIISNIDLIKDTTNKLSSLEIYKLFDNINVKENSLIKYIFYDYEQKIYEAIYSTNLYEKANEFSKSRTDNFKQMDMLFVYYSLLLKRNEIEIDAHNDEIFNDDKGYVVNMLHYSNYHLIPFLLSRLTSKELVLYANEGAINKLNKIMTSIDPKSTQNLTLLPVSYKSALKAVRKVKKGAILLIMPEIDTGGDKKGKELNSYFLGQEITLPYGAQKIASIAKVDVKLLYLEIVEDHKCNINVQNIKTGLNHLDTTTNLWNEIEKVVQTNPYNWTIWEMWEDIKVGNKLF